LIALKTIGFAAGILLPVTLTVCASEESPSTRISVMSYNIENGGAQVDFNKTVEAIKKSGADVVGIQEAWGNIPRLAKAVGWKYYDQRQHIISRFPLFEAPDSHGLYTFVEVLPAKMVAMANMHRKRESRHHVSGCNDARIRLHWRQHLYRHAVSERQRIGNRIDAAFILVTAAPNDVATQFAASANSRFQFQKRAQLLWNATQEFST
jgi:hypothetical protein